MLDNLRRAINAIFDPNKRATARDIELSRAMSAKYPEFMEQARKAGFTGPQADFLWTYCPHVWHTHEIDKNKYTSGAILR